MTADLMRLRDDVLRAALPHIAFDGWTDRAMRRGASDLRLDRTEADRAFPYGAADMIDCYNDLLDRDMLEELERRGIDRMKVRDRIATAVRVRLELAVRHKEAVRRAVAILALPVNARTAAISLYRTVDRIWIAAGDAATDWNFYSKRALLAGVYASTCLYWLNDKSDGAADSWAFLDRRIADVMRIPSIPGRLRSAFERFPPPFAGCLPRAAGGMVQSNRDRL